MLLGAGRNQFLYDLVAVPALMVLYVPTLYLHVNHYPLSTIELPLWFIAVNVSGVCLVLIALRELLGYYVDQIRRFDPMMPDAPQSGDAVAAVEPQPVPLLERLPEAVRGAVLRIAADNHYIDVRTERGTSLILMRLSDAIRELEGQAGLQVHRSHWVADCAVAELQREGARLSVVLTSGTRVPVSRSQSAAAMQRWAHVYEGALSTRPVSA